ncbi:Phosphatidylserine decarboxylase [Blattamonas nauphoetae]|uniref:Phosphatidylserine decarboxylase n=1 Tax=Blattamonas nauphoetae TaxID=2049346 RepID=A0ABQ9YCX0_9EUKA|nr:Phosphatidylserine decarboxylase [Blattamonas nauphoetae]
MDRNSPDAVLETSSPQITVVRTNSSVFQSLVDHSLLDKAIASLSDAWEGIMILRIKTLHLPMSKTGPITATVRFEQNIYYLQLIPQNCIQHTFIQYCVPHEESDQVTSQTDQQPYQSPAFTPSSSLYSVQPDSNSIIVKNPKALYRPPPDLDTLSHPEHVVKDDGSVECYLWLKKASLAHSMVVSVFHRVDGKPDTNAPKETSRTTKSKPSSPEPGQIKHDRTDEVPKNSDITQYASISDPSNDKQTQKKQKSKRRVKEQYIGSVTLSINDLLTKRDAADKPFTVKGLLIENTFLMDRDLSLGVYHHRYSHTDFAIPFINPIPATPSRRKDKNAVAASPTLGGSTPGTSSRPQFAPLLPSTPIIASTSPIPSLLSHLPNDEPASEPQPSDEVNPVDPPAPPIFDAHFVPSAKDLETIRNRDQKMTLVKGTVTLEMQFVSVQTFVESLYTKLLVFFDLDHDGYLNPFEFSIFLASVCPTIIDIHSLSPPNLRPDSSPSSFVPYPPYFEQGNPDPNTHLASIQSLVAVLLTLNPRELFERSPISGLHLLPQTTPLTVLFSTLMHELVVSPQLQSDPLFEIQAFLGNPASILQYSVEDTLENPTCCFLPLGAGSSRELIEEEQTRRSGPKNGVAPTAPAPPQPGPATNVSTPSKLRKTQPEQTKQKTGNEEQSPKTSSSPQPKSSVRHISRAGKLMFGTTPTLAPVFTAASPPLYPVQSPIPPFDAPLSRTPFLQSSPDPIIFSTPTPDPIKPMVEELERTTVIDSIDYNEHTAEQHIKGTLSLLSRFQKMMGGDDLYLDKDEDGDEDGEDSDDRNEPNANHLDPNVGLFKLLHPDDEEELKFEEDLAGQPIANPTGTHTESTSTKKLASLTVPPLWDYNLSIKNMRAYRHRYSKARNRVNELLDSRCLRVVDRETGLVVKEHLPSSLIAAFQVSYCTEWGRRMIQSAPLKKFFEKSTKSMGKKKASKESTKEIYPFINQYGIDISEMEKPPEAFSNFDDFFSRRLLPAARPIAGRDDPTVIVSPADCRLVVFETVDQAKQLWIKGEQFTLGTLLGGIEELIRLFGIERVDPNQRSKQEQKQEKRRQKEAKQQLKLASRAAKTEERQQKKQTKEVTKHFEKRKRELDKELSAILCSESAQADVGELIFQKTMLKLFDQNSIVKVSGKVRRLSLEKLSNCIVSDLLAGKVCLLCSACCVDHPLETPVDVPLNTEIPPHLAELKCPLCLNPWLSDSERLSSALHRIRRVNLPKGESPEVRDDKVVHEPEEHHVIQTTAEPEAATPLVESDIPDTPPNANVASPAEALEIEPKAPSSSIAPEQASLSQPADVEPREANPTIPSQQEVPTASATDPPTATDPSNVFYSTNPSIRAAIALSRLAPQDYHRVHSPLDCDVIGIHHIPGEYYTVNPIAVRQNVNVFTDNNRLLFHLRHELTDFVLVMVGACFVGCCKSVVSVGQHVAKGDEIGIFLHGGSTVLVIVPTNEDQGLSVTFDDDLMNATNHKIETLVRMGTHIGTMHLSRQ